MRKPVAAALAILGFAIVGLTPHATARPHVGISVNISVPGHIHAYDRYRYEPYYVGRVFYEPDHRWQLIYSFPVQTHFGVVYEPYVYDAGRLVCHDYIPGPEAGYGAIVVDGRGRYDPRWQRARHAGHGYERSVVYRNSNRYARDKHWRDRDRHDDDSSDSGSGRRHDRCSDRRHRHR